MFKRALVFIGTICSGALIVLGLFWLLNSSTPGVYAKSPSARTVNTALLHPALVPPGCQVVNSDISLNTTWTKSCYHIVTDTVTVWAGVTLRITPPTAGTWVYFQSGARLQVLGTLQALGTAARGITFTAANGSNPWAGIVLDQDGGDLIQYSTIEHAETGVKINDEDDVNLQNNVFRYNGNGGIYGGAVGGDMDNSSILNNTIYSCANGIILNEAFNNDISDNVIYDIDHDGLAFVGDMTVGGSNNDMAGNEVYRCSENGIRLENGDSNTVQDNIIHDNGGAGIVVDRQSSTQLQGNQVLSSALNAGAVAGIVITNSSHNIALSLNEIMYNGHPGGYLGALYVENMTSTLFGNNLIVNSNVIYDLHGAGIYYADDNANPLSRVQSNAICALSSFELENRRSGHTIDARYDWWGTNTPAIGTNPLTDNIYGSATIDPSISLTVTSVPTRMSATVGATAAVQITMNDGAGHTVPDGARQIHLTSDTGTLSPSVVTLDNGGQAASTLTLTDLPADGQVTITATASCDFSVTTTISVEHTNLAIAKTVDVSQIVPGESLTYRITYSNTSSVDASSVRITDTLPAGATWAGDTAVAGGWTRVATAPQPIWSMPTLSPGAYGSFVVTVTAPPGAVCGQLLTNWASIGTATAETTTADNTSSAGPVEVIQPGVVVSKTGDVHSKVGDSVTYQFQITNNSCPASSPPLILDSMVDIGIGWSGLGGLTNVARANGCDPLSYGASCSFAIQHTVQAGEPDPSHDSVDVHYHPQGFATDVSDSDVHSVNLFQPSITFDKTGDAQGKVGDDVDYTLTLNNTSSLDAPNLACTITDAMLGINQNVTLASGDSHVINATYTVPAGAPDPLVNTAQVSCSPIGFPNVLTDSDSHSVDLFQPNVQVAKTGPTAAYVDDTITYTFHVTNASSLDSPPLVLDSAIDVGTGWPGLGDLTTIARANGCDLLPAGDTCSFAVQHTLSNCNPGPLTNTVAVHYHPQGFTNDVAHSDSHTVELERAVNLFVTKHDDVDASTPLRPTLVDGEDEEGLFDQQWLMMGSSGPLAPIQTREFAFEGDVVTYTITVINTGSYTATNVVLTETLPLYAEYLGYGWTHVHSRTYTLPAGTLPPDAWQIRRFVVRITDTLPYTVDEVINRVCGGSTEHDIDPTENCRYENTPVRRRLVLTKTPAVLGITPGNTITFTVFYSNPNSVAFGDARLTDTLPAGTVWSGDDATAEGWTRLQTTPQVVWTMPTMAPSAQGSFVLSVTVPAAATCGITLTNIIALSVPNDGASYLAASDTADFRLLCPIDLLAIKNDNVGSTQQQAFVYEGDLITYTVVVLNVGTNTVNNVVLSETLPAYTDYVGHGWTHVSGSTYITTVGTLTPGSGHPYYFTVRVHDVLPEGISYIANQVCTWGTEPDDYLANNCSGEDTPIYGRLLRVDKSAPGCISPGDTFTYTITYANDVADITFSNVVLTDTLDPFVNYAGGPEWNCAGQICNRTIPSIPPMTSGAVPLRVQLSPAFPITTRTIVTNVVEIDGGQRFVLIHTVGTCPDLAVVKHDDVTFAQPGQLLTYTIVYSNVGVGAATGVVLTETLPLYTDYVGYGWTQVDARTYTLAVGTLLPNDWGSRTFVVRITDTLLSGVSYLANLVCGGSEGEDLDPSDNCASEDTLMTLRPYLTKTALASEASAGEIFTFTINYGNPSSDTLTGALITDALPVDTHWHGDTAPAVGWTRQMVANGQVVWSKPTLVAGEHGSFALSVIVSPTNPALCGTTLANVITLSALSNGERQYVDPGTAPFRLTCSVNLTLDLDDEVEFTPLLMRLPIHPLQVSQHRDFVVPGDLITYTFSVANQGWITATNVVLSDTLPLYTTYMDRGYGWQQVGVTRYYTVSLPDLPPGASETVYFVVRVDDPLPSHVRDITNYACAFSSEPDSDPTDNCRLETAPVLGLTLDKTANPTSVEPGRLVTYTITLDNLDQISGFGPSGGITITDALPAGFTYVADTAASAGFARLATSPVVVWYAPTTTLGANVSFTLIARAPAALNCANWMTNTATASLTLNGQPHDWIATAGVWIPCPIDLLVLKDDDVGPTALMSAEAAPAAGTQVAIDQLLQKAQVNAPLAPVQHRSFVREGDLITYTIVAANAGTSVVTNVTVSETLPLYTDYVGHGWTYLGGRTYVMTAGTLSPGSVGIYYFVVRVYDTLPDGVETLINRVCGWADEPDQYPQNNCNYEDTPVRRRPLQVIKVADPCVSPGDAFDYTITYQNISTGTTFYNVLLTDTLDPYVSYTGGPEWSCAGGVCNRTIPAIPPGVSGTLQLPAQLSAGLPATQMAFTNTVVISGGNRFVLATPVDTFPDLSVLKNDNVGPLPLVLQTQWNDLRQRLSLGRQPASIQATQQREFVYPGELITYTILYINNGQTTATNVELTERLPDYTSYVGGGWTYAGGQQYTLNVSDLAPGQGGEVQFIVQVSDFFPPGEDRVINRVNIAGQEAECNLSNNQSGEDTPVHPYPLQVIKTADTCIMPGDEFNYAVTYQNTTTDTTYSNVVLTDTLGPYVTYVGGPEWTCVGQTCNRTIATILPGGSGSFPLRAQLSASFPYTMQTVFTNMVAISGGNRYLLITSIDVGPDLALVKNDNVGLVPPGLQQPEVVLPGELITYTILYVNGGLGPATNVVLTETLPQYTTYAGDASWQDAGGGLYTRSVGDLAAGQGGIASFVVQVDDPLPANVNWAINQVEIGSGTPECNLTNNQSFEQTPLSSGGVLTFTLHKDGPMSTYPNSVITYTIVTVNNGPLAPGVTLSDAVPNGTIFIPGSCSYSINGGLNQPCDASYPDPSDVMWQEDLATGDRVVTTFSVRVAVGTMGVVMLQNCATLDWGSGQMADCADTMVVPPFLEKTGPATAGSGERITYTVVSENNTDMPIPDATLSDPIPNGAAFVPGTCSYSVNGGISQSCALDYPSLSDVMWQEDLAPGDRITTTFSVAVITGTMGVADVQNCVTLGWQGSQAVNCFTTRITSTGPILYKTAPQVACQNDVITYTIVASNVTGLAVPGVILTDTIPNGTVYVPGSCYYQVNAGTPQPCGLPPLLWQQDFAPGDHITTTFAVTVTAGTMGWPIGNCAVFNWSGRQLWACATTIVGRCDQRVYVANRDSGTVDVFDLNGYSYVETIPMGINPFGMVMIGDFLFAVDFDEPANRGRLYVVNTLLDRVVDSPLVGAHPIHIAAYDHHIYVASHSSRPAITVYDYVSGQVVAQPLLDRYLTYEFGFFGATTDESRGCVYLTKRDFGSVGIWRICPPSSSGPWIPEFVYGTNEMSREKPSSILYHPDLDRVYVTFGLIDELWVFDPETWQLVERLPTGVQDPADPGYGGHGLASLGECIFVANYIGQSVTAVVDGSCVDRTRVMATPPSPSTSRAHRVYLPLVIRNLRSGQQIPQQQRIVTIPVSGRPKGLVAGAGNLLFVTMPEDGSGNPLNRIAVIDTETLQVVHEIQALGDHPHTVILRQITVSGTRSKPSGTLLLP